MYNDLFSVGPFTVHGYGLMIGLGVLAAVLWGGRRAKNHGRSDDFMISMALWVIVFGFVGSKILFVITEWRSFLADPLSLLGSEGFVVYGGLIGGLLAAYIYCRVHHENILEWLDYLVPGVALAQAFGRVGCFLAGCCYGKACDCAISVVFPAGSFAPAGVPLLPVQLFSAAGNLLICIALLLLERRKKHHGFLLGCYFLLYSVGRFIIEFWRDDPRGTVGVLSTSQFIAIFGVIFSAALLRYLSRRPESLAAAETGEDAAGEDAELTDKEKAE